MGDHKGGAGRKGKGVRVAAGQTTIDTEYTARRATFASNDSAAATLKSGKPLFKGEWTRDTSPRGSGSFFHANEDGTTHRVTFFSRTSYDTRRTSTGLRFRMESGTRITTGIEIQTTHPNTSMAPITQLFSVTAKGESPAAEARTETQRQRIIARAQKQLGIELSPYGFKFN